MIAALDELWPEADAALAVWFLVFLRVGAVMTLLPAFGEQNVPLRVRLALAFAFTMIVAPAVGAALGEVLSSGASFGLIAGGEVAAGLAMGIAFRLVVIALQMAGTIAANVTSLSQVFGGAGVDPQPAISNILLISGLALAVMLGLHIRVAEALIGSYLVLPAGRLPEPADLAEWGVGQVASAFSLAFVLAAPFTIGALLYNLALGAINRAMPQLMVAFVGAPAITWGTLVLFALSAPVMLTLWLEVLNAALAAPMAPR
jgi:flagellar biosynthetic protein FliR